MRFYPCKHPSMDHPRAKLRERRLAKGHTQRYVAERAGVTAQLVSYVERGAHLPTRRLANVIHRLYRISQHEWDRAEDERRAEA